VVYKIRRLDSLAGHGDALMLPKLWTKLHRFTAFGFVGSLAARP
jgi:hypothetical protein